MGIEEKYGRHDSDGQNLPAMQETQEMGVRSLGQEDPLEKGMATYFSILALENPMDREAWRGYSPWGRKESDMNERLTHYET